MSKLRLNAVAAVLIAMLVFLQYKLWFDNGGMRELFGLKKSLASQMEENQKIKQHNDELLFQIRRLQNSNDAAEARARSELGMIKKDETFYQIVK